MSKKNLFLFVLITFYLSPTLYAQNPFYSDIENFFKDDFSFQDLKKEEDKDFAYYHLEAEGLDAKNVNVNYQDGRVEVSSKIEVKSENKRPNGSIEKSSSYSEFFQQFSIPKNLDGSKITVIPEKKGILLKIPKLKSNSQKLNVEEGARI